MKTRWLKKGLKVVIMAIVAVAVFGFLVMSLWNWLAPDVLGARTITFWQALGLLVLSKILFGGFRGGPGYGGHWKGRMRDRWEQMTPEEREKIFGKDDEETKNRRKKKSEQGCNWCDGCLCLGYSCDCGSACAGGGEAAGCCGDGCSALECLGACSC